MEEELAIELDRPDGVEEAESAVEVLRAWIGDGALLVSLNSSACADQVGDWGRLLAEIGHHVAKAAALNGYMREEAAHAALREAFVASFETTPGPTSGKLRGQIKH
jgi:predicted secreted protein